MTMQPNASRARDQSRKLLARTTRLRERGRMPTYDVEADVGKLNATVEAADEEDAINAAISEWDEAADILFSAATFDVRPVND